MQTEHTRDTRKVDGVPTDGALAPETTPYLSMVIPTYNEAHRLAPTLEAVTEYLAIQPYDWELIISDDGSKDRTIAIAYQFAEQWPQIRVLAASRNRGKGAVIRAGVLAARGRYVLFSDADLSTPIHDVEKLISALQNDCDVAIGSRAMPDSDIVTNQGVARRIMGTVFRTIVHRLALPRIRDSQCGFKAFHASTARHIFAQLRTERFAFDVEALLLAEALGYSISELGVTWTDRPGTTVSPIKDSWRMLRDIYGLRKGVRARLDDELQSMPGDDDLCVALITLHERTMRRSLQLDSLLRGEPSSEACLVLEATHDSALVAAFGVTPRQAGEVAASLAARLASDAVERGESAIVSNDVERLALPTPISWLRQTSLDPISGGGNRLLTKLNLEHQSREADRQAFERREEAWRQRRRTVRSMILINLVGLAWWLDWLYNYGHAANTFLYTLLVLAESFNVTQVLGYWYTVWHDRAPERKRARVAGRVDVFVTTYNEPVHIVEQTVRAAIAMPYPHRTYVLDDGHRPEMGAMAERLGAHWIHRPDNRGAKAGNVNHALAITEGDFFAVFDADHVPHPEFLSRMMPFMDDAGMGLVQAPQYYANREKTYIASGAMDQQEIFFGPICGGKDGVGAVFCCGTNMIIRRSAIEDVAGFREDSVTEDAATSLDLHERGWKSRYVDERLAEGLAPEDLGAYISQQRRWARGNLEMLFKFRIMRRHMPLRVRLQYVWSAMYYLTGLTTLLYVALPSLFLLFGTETVNALSGDFIAHFLPYIFLTIFILARSAEGRLRFRAIQLSYGLFPVFNGALMSIITSRKFGFQVTPKERSAKSFYRLIVPQIVVVIILLIAILVGSAHYSGPRTVTNACWALFDVFVLSGIIRAAAPQRGEESRTQEIVELTEARRRTA